MDTEQQEKTHERKYLVVSIEKTDPPEGMPEGDWHRYVIGRGGSIIEGFQPGSLKAVTQYVETYVEELNERAIKGHSAYATRKRK